jgi:hypothetical protein
VAKNRLRRRTKLLEFRGEPKFFPKNLRRGGKLQLPEADSLALRRVVVTRRPPSRDDEILIENLQK